MKNFSRLLRWKNQRSLTSAIFAAAICLCFSADAYEKLNWAQRSLSVGKVDLSSGGYSITRTLAIANFAPELALPIQLVYDSDNSRTGVFGANWFSPQLESRVFPRDDGAEWLAPWGEAISFFKKENASGYFAPYSDWEASGANGNWKIKHKDGWVFDYKDSRLREISSPSDRKLSFDYDGEQLKTVSLNGAAFIELFYDKTNGERGTLNALTVNDERFSF